MSAATTYAEWIRRVKDMKGGALGMLVIVITVVCTGAGAWYGMDLFPAGRYPRFLLAIPGLIAGAVAFFVSSGIAWQFGKGR